MRDCAAAFPLEMERTPRRMREAPRWVKCCAAESPIPDAPPVMRTVFPLKVSGGGIEREMKGSLKRRRRPIRDGIIVRSR